MTRKYVNYAVFIAIVVLVVGLAYKRSRDMARLVDDMAGSDSKARVAAAQELVKSEQFMDAITGETVERRILIAQALEDWADKSATTQAVAFLKDMDRPVRDRVALVLTSIGARNADNLGALITGIQDGDANARAVCVQVAQALGQTDPALAMERLVRTMPDTDPRKIQAALAFRKPEIAAQIATKVADLMKTLPGARGTGGDVIAALPDMAGSVATLLPLLADKDDGICSAAAAALGKVGSPAPVPQLVEAMHKRSTQVRRVAIGALALIADRSCEPALIEALNTQTDDNEARAQATTGLGKIGGPEAISALIRALGDDDLKVQVAAVNAIGRAGVSAVGAANQALASGAPALRVRCVQALGSIGDPVCNAGLASALRDKEPSVRLAAAVALGRAGNTGGVGALAAQLASPDSELARACGEALAQIGDAARPALCQALSGSESGAVFAAAALSKLGDTAVPDIAAVGARGGNGARWAATALAGIQGPNALAELKRIAAGSDPEAARIAQMAITRAGM